MTSQIPPVSMHGAVDLASLARPAAAEGTVAAHEITEATFESVVQRSMSTPVVVALVSAASPACADLLQRLGALVDGYDGALEWGSIDIDAQPRLAQAFQVTAVPTVLALVGARPLPLFQGNADDAQITSVLDQVVQFARGGAPADTEEQQGEPEQPLPPEHQRAYEAIERGDLDAAAAAFEQALQANPKDSDAKAGLAQVQLMARTATADPAAVRQASADNPQDVDAQLAVADLDILGGHVEDAFARLIDLVRATAGDDRERVRTRLVELFEVVGGHDQRVVSARQALAAALY